MGKFSDAWSEKKKLSQSCNFYHGNWGLGVSDVDTVTASDVDIVKILGAKILMHAGGRRPGHGTGTEIAT